MKVVWGRIDDVVYGPLGPQLESAIVSFHFEVMACTPRMRRKIVKPHGTELSIGSVEIYEIACVTQKLRQGTRMFMGSKSNKSMEPIITLLVVSIFSKCRVEVRFSTFHVARLGLNQSLNLF